MDPVAFGRIASTPFRSAGRPPEKVLQVYNRYRVKGHGEDAVVSQTLALLRKGNVETSLLESDSADVGRGFYSRLRVAATTCYSSRAYRRARQAIQAGRPDIVHAHNLYPLLTPSVLAASRHLGVPSVLTAHNYFLTCPVYTHLSRGSICMRCVGGREYNCIRLNCRKSLPESILYALRAALTRRFNLIFENVCLVVALSRFAAKQFELAGYPAARIAVLPNSVALPSTEATPRCGQYIAYAGRLTYSKGVDLLLAAAGLTGLPVYLAGNTTEAEMPLEKLPNNVKFVGQLDRAQMVEFYLNARFCVVPSRWVEMCPLVVLEAMSFGLPVVAFRVGGMAELVVDGETGLLCDLDRPEDLADKMLQLWDSPDECAEYGASARERVSEHFNECEYFDKLINVYRRAADLGHGTR
jgi:glycosyltransferase involved in cell wall biosynthesis